MKGQYVEKLTFIWKLRNTLKNNIQFKKEFTGQRTNNQQNRQGIKIILEQCQKGIENINVYKKYKRAQINNLSTNI